MSIFDTTLLRDFALNENASEEIKTPITTADDSEMETPNVEQFHGEEPTDDNPISKKLKDPTMSKDELEDLEYSIDMNNEDLTESVTNTYNEINKLLYESVYELDAVAISAIHDQYKILTESVYGSEEYNERIGVLIESTSESVFTKIINWISHIIEVTRDILKKLGFEISMGFVNYTKYVEENEKELIEKSEKFGKTVGVEMHKWSNDILKEINFRSLNSVVDEAIADVNDKSSMERELENSRSKCGDKFSDAVYCYTFIKIMNRSEKFGDIIDRDKAKADYMASLKWDKKQRYVDITRTKEFISKLKTIKIDSSRVLASTRNSISPEFDKLKRSLNAELKQRKIDGKDESIKSSYYRMRYTAIVSVQTAITDALKIKSKMMIAYAKEMYEALKTLKGHEPTVTNESIDLSGNIDIKGITLHE